MASLWTACDGAAHVGPLRVTAQRIVESQTVAATLRLVANLEEQQVLEDLLEGTKPAVPEAARGRHYLLMTPFRYPPLPHGSRFGARHEPGIFYGSLATRTLLAECAYYRLVFFDGMATPPPDGRLLTQHTSFRASVRATRAVRLEQAPFDHHVRRIASPDDYRDTQRLGIEMRAAGVEACTYPSARDGGSGLNIAVFTPHALASRTPSALRGWLCTTLPAQVIFQSAPAGERYAFPRAQFLIAGRLPTPAI